MAPKKSTKKDDLNEPEHDTLWQRAIEAGEWLAEPSKLPDAFVWPTWGALRERILQSCQLISTEQAATARDAFAAEIVKLSPPRLVAWSMHRCPNLRRFVLSPARACPLLTTLNLSYCQSLRHVHIQSTSLQSIDVSNNPELVKAIIYAPNAHKLVFDNCPKLATVLVWSEQVTSVKLPGCTSLESLQLRCEKLAAAPEHPLLRAMPIERPDHAPLHAIITASHAARADSEAHRTAFLLRKHELGLTPPQQLFSSAIRVELL